MLPQRNPEVITKLLPDGHAVLFSVNNSWAHTVTPLAAITWEYCDGMNSEEEICSRVAKLAQTNDADNLKTEIQELIRGFIELGLLQ